MNSEIISTIKSEKKSQSLSENLKNLLVHLSTTLKGLTQILNAEELKPYKKYLDIQEEECTDDEEDFDSEGDFDDTDIEEEDSDTNERDTLIKRKIMDTCDQKGGC